MFQITPPAFRLDCDPPITTRVVVVVEGLNPDGTSWVQIFAPGLTPESAGELLWSGVHAAIEDDGQAAVRAGCFNARAAIEDRDQRRPG